MAVELDKATWNHGTSRNGAVTYINAPDESSHEQCLVAIVSAEFCQDAREEIATVFCAALASAYGEMDAPA